MPRLTDRNVFYRGIKPLLQSQAEFPKTLVNERTKAEDSPRIPSWALCPLWVFALRLEWFAV
jgi:hypothetical protein